MRINEIEFENFRNYRDKGSITFPHDGNVTVIYGPNGVGKTTLHQFFQWVIYGETHFNKTTGNEMYNLDYEKNAKLNQEFAVRGRIDFEHPDKNNVIQYYSLRRKWVYRKELKGSKLISQSCSLQRKKGDDWGNPISYPERMIEQILPSGLSQYFFFDGESMIADLGTTGQKSAKSLRKALYRLFDLDIYENALAHLGKEDSTSTVLGKLHTEWSKQATDQKIVMQRKTFESIQKNYAKIDGEVKVLKKEIAEREEDVRFLSEKIGQATSKKALEAQRKSIKNNIKSLEDSIKDQKLQFGTSVMSQYPYLFIARVVEEAQLRIGLKVEDQKLPRGLTKELVETLLEDNVCLCGNPISEKERSALEGLRAMFPPLSYKYIYDQFKQSATHWTATYSDELLAKHLKKIFEIRDTIDQSRKSIRDIDEALKQGDNVDHLIEQRSFAEKELKKLRSQLSQKEKDLGVQHKFVEQEKGKLDKMLSENNVAMDLQLRKDVIEEVRKHFEQKLLFETNAYSKDLQHAIQSLLDCMLSGTRRVSVTSKFELSVKDNFGKEDKSEGQFAISSFAYIGGICKLLRDIPSLSDKEFPLVLDGPFSKLDAQHRQNVVDTIPTYAPQVILFSKDDINDCFGESGPDHVWTIYSNDDRHISKVEPGYNPEVFLVNADHS
jgi:DNA sulfur modification protein DndD